MATEPPPGTVTALEPDGRGVVRVHVDGRVLLSVSADVAERLAVRVGDRLTGERHGALCRAADEEAAWRTLLRALERRPFAARDMARRLVLKGHPPEAADAAVGRAQRTALLDDGQFARHYVQTRAARGRGPARLRRELAAMGVDARLADRVLAEELPADSQAERVTALARRRAGQLAALDRPDRLRRVVAFLARKGYRGPAVRNIARSVLDG